MTAPTILPGAQVNVYFPQRARPGTRLLGIVDLQASAAPIVSGDVLHSPSEPTDGDWPSSLDTSFP